MLSLDCHLSVALTCFNVVGRKCSSENVYRTCDKLIKKPKFFLENISVLSENYDCPELQ